jgi:teichuronic acid biosynthesis glycosyltransferase TuaG
MVLEGKILIFMAKVSVIIPFFNSTLTIDRCLKSVQAQDYQDYEVILVNDGSTDDTSERVNGFAKEDFRVTQFSLGTNRGVHAARNRGMELAQGEILVFLDSDDELVPNALALCAKQFSGLNESFGVLFANGIDDQGRLTGIRISESGVVPFEELLCERCFYPHKNCFAAVRRSKISAIKWEAPHCDFIFWRRLQSRSNTYQLNEILMKYHGDSPNSLSTLRRRRSYRYRIAGGMARALDGFVREYYTPLSENCPAKLANYLYASAATNLLSGNRRKAFNASRDLIRLKFTFRALILMILLAFPVSWVRLLYLAERD